MTVMFACISKSRPKCQKKEHHNLYKLITGNSYILSILFVYFCIGTFLYNLDQLQLEPTDAIQVHHRNRLEYIHITNFKNRTSTKLNNNLLSIFNWWVIVRYFIFLADKRYLHIKYTINFKLWAVKKIYARGCQISHFCARVITVINNASILSFFHFYRKKASKFRDKLAMDRVHLSQWKR